MHIAAQHGQMDTVRLLVSSGADIEALDQEKNTQLLSASRSGQVSTVKILLELGVDRFKKNEYGYDAAYYASQDRNEALEQVLHP